MRCPYCRALDDKVVDSRLTEDGVAIRRRRECLSCGRRSTTYERLEELPLLVVKRSGVKEPFERAKLVAGIARATGSGPVDLETVEAIALGIEEHVRTRGPEVPTEVVGLAVLERLRALDPVSYLRFASVYKGFDDVSDFTREVGLLRKNTAPKSRAARDR